MQIRISICNSLRKSVYERLRQAYATGNLRLIRRIHALLQIADGQPLTNVTEMLNLGEQTVRDYIRAFVLKGVNSLVYKRPPGRPPKLTKTQRREPAKLIEDGPEKAGYESGCWTALMIQDLIERRFAAVYHPHYICELLRHMDFSFQKARFVSDHLDEARRSEWMERVSVKVFTDGCRL
jgi:transposase